MPVLSNVGAWFCDDFLSVTVNGAQALVLTVEKVRVRKWLDL